MIGFFGLLIGATWLAASSAADKMHDDFVKQETAAWAAEEKRLAAMYKSNFNSDQELLDKIFRANDHDKFLLESFKLIKPNLDNVFGKVSDYETMNQFFLRTNFNFDRGSPREANAPANWLFHLLRSLEGKIANGTWICGWRPGDSGDYQLNMKLLKEVQDNLMANGCPIRLVAQRNSSSKASPYSFRGDTIVPECQVYPNGYIKISPWSY